MTIATTQTFAPWNTWTLASNYWLSNSKPWIRPWLLEAEPGLARKLAHLTSVLGIGLTTAIVAVAENNGLILIENEQQLASYAGLDVVQCQGDLLT